jgi:putative chitinase
MLGDIDTNVFCSYFRDIVCGGRLSFKQKDGLDHIFNYAIQHYPDMSHAQLAYIIATAYHESARTLQPIAEMGSSSYLKSKPYYPYIGAGLIQVTWQENYEKFGAVKTEDLLTWPIALDALFRGMLDGMFTGKKLGDFVQDQASIDAFEQARVVVNGHDQDALIAGYAMSAMKCLDESTKDQIDYRSGNPVTEKRPSSNTTLVSATTTAVGGTIAAVSNIQGAVNTSLQQSKENVNLFANLYNSLGDFAPWIIISLIVIGTSVILIREIKHKSENGDF